MSLTARYVSAISGPPLRVLGDSLVGAAAVAVGDNTHFAPGLDTHPVASLFNSRPWLSALADTYIFDVRAALLQRRGTMAALLSSAVADLRGRRIISLPFSDYVDSFVDKLDDWSQLVEPLLQLGAPVRLRCRRTPIPAADVRFRTTGAAFWHAVDLSRSEPEIWASLAVSARQNIRKAERRGLAIRRGATIDDLRIFYRMHCPVRKAKYRFFAQQFRFFEALHTAFSPDNRIFLLLTEINGEAVAGVLLLIHRDTLYYNAQPGLVRFKKKFATEERAIAVLESPAPGTFDTAAESASDALRQLSIILTAPETPDDVTRAVGDELYRFF